MSSRTRQMSVKELDSKLNNLTTHFTEELSKFKGELKHKTVIDIDSEETNNDLLRRLDEFESSIKENIKNLQNQINLLRNQNDKIIKDMDSHAQRQNSNKLILYGLPQTENENLLPEVIKLFSEKFLVNIDKSEIYNGYRLGTKTPNKKRLTTDKPRPRPVIVEFTTVWRRNEIFYKKSNLKGSHLVLSEVLTINRLEIFHEAKKQFQRDCWINAGKIVINSNNKLHYICEMDELNNLRHGN